MYFHYKSWNIQHKNNLKTADLRLQTISLIDAKHFALLQCAICAQSRGLPFQVRAVLQIIKGIYKNL